jgi:uncharacterized protein YcfJ
MTNRNRTHTNSATKNTFLAAALLAAGVVPLATGCETKTQSGALVGGLGGAAVGAAIGSNNGSAGGGALIGGAAGALGGALIGNGMDHADEKKAKEAEAHRRRDERSYASDKALSRTDVMRWSKDGVSDEVIIDRIERSGTIFRLTAKDENTLRDQGLSEDVIEAMKDTARRSTRAE